jgi:hypothetical protein
MKVLVILAGCGQLALALASIALPRVLGWREDTAKLRPLTREVFWTYAVYIWSINVSFGLVSALAPHWLLDGSPLAMAVCGFIAFYWGARLAIQLVAFGKHAPPGALFKVAEAAMTALFLSLTVIYGWVVVGPILGAGRG